MPTWVCSRTQPEGLREDDVTFVRDAVATVRRLKGVEGDTRPLWLWGGGELFRELAAAGEVDGVDVAVIPMLLGGGLPVIAPPAPRLPLRLRAHRLYPRSGIMTLEYDVVTAQHR
jgi:dihydrofolate reductase